MKATIFISASTFADIDPAPLDLIKQSGLSYFINPHGRRLTAQELIELGKGLDCQAALAGLEPYDRQVLDALTSLKCISRLGVGIDNIDQVYAKEKNIAIFNTPGVVAQPVAELTVGMVFDLLRRISLQTSHLKNGKWKKYTGNLLRDKNVGILGLGRIGRASAMLFSKLSAKVYAYDPYPDKAWASQNSIGLVSLEELLKISDIFCLHAAYDSKNSFVLGKKEISLMKQGAFVINTSRGKLIDEQALYQALQENKLAGAGLDVFVQEPYSGNLTELDNVVLTPHVGTLTNESRLEMELEAVENVLKFFAKSH